MKLFRIPGTGNSILSLDRVWAGMWPYRPQYLDAVRHPSRGYRLDGEFVHVDDVRLRTVKLALRTLREDAPKILADEVVKHLEVRIITLGKYGAHSGCDLPSRCLVCDWLYFTPDYYDGYLLGWVAVLKNKSRVLHEEH